jgi:O-antigen/teichoic acid export membrane protein
VVHVVCSVVQSGTVLGLALGGAGYWALAAGAILGRVLEVATLMHAAGWTPRLAWPGRAQPGLIWFGMHAGLSSLLWYVYSNCDFAIVGMLAGQTALGWYALAFQLISLPVQKLTANTNQVIYPVFCRLQNDRPRLRDWYLRLTVLLGFLGVPTLVGMALVAPDAFALVLGPKWTPAVLPFQLLSVVGILMVYSYSLPPLFNALGRPEINLRYTATCTVLFPLAFLAGGLLAGLTGICVAWLILYPLAVATLVHLTRSVTGVGLDDLLRAQLPVAGAALCMIGVVLAVQAALADASWPWLRLGACIVAGAATYAGVMLVFARHTVLADVRRLMGEMRGGGSTS